MHIKSPIRLFFLLLRETVFVLYLDQQILWFSRTWDASWRFFFKENIPKLMKVLQASKTKK